jgi:hypothetical protein
VTLNGVVGEYVGVGSEINTKSGYSLNGRREVKTLLATRSQDLIGDAKSNLVNVTLRQVTNVSDAESNSRFE